MGPRLVWSSNADLACLSSGCRCFILGIAFVPSAAIPRFAFPMRTTKYLLRIHVQSLARTVIRLAWAFGFFGIVIVTTPFLLLAVTLAKSTSAGSGIMR